ncbi:MAG: GNAT family N-acetyltransferase [Bacteroidales bacterium]|nr:GNAT family N-acetyltransferase [Bacteroidales bacterium]
MPIKPIIPISLIAEEGASLSSGSLRLYALLSGSSPKLGEGDPKEGGVCGAIDLYSYDPLNRRAAVGIMVANEYRRQGYALAMLRELQQIATNNYKLHTLYADIAATNTASIALFRKAGYEECGRFKEWLNIDDTYIDTIRLQKIL